MVKKRINDHLANNSLFNLHQSAYIKSHSTETVLLSLQDYLIHSINRQEISGLCLLDLSSAFDTIDYTILLHRLPTWFVIEDLVLS